LGVWDCAQAIVPPNGLIANLFGPVEGKRHDSATMLAQSQVLPQLQNHSLDTINGNILCIYGDPAYPTSKQIQGPSPGAMLTGIQKG
jgi:hypothetical protein